VQFDQDSDYSEDLTNRPSRWDDIFADVAPIQFFILALFGPCYVGGPFLLCLAAMGLLVCREKAARRNAAILFAIGLFQCLVIAHVLWGSAI
jgi:hypothetical protein